MEPRYSDNAEDELGKKSKIPQLLTQKPYYYQGLIPMMGPKTQSQQNPQACDFRISILWRVDPRYRVDAAIGFRNCESTLGRVVDNRPRVVSAEK